MARFTAEVTRTDNQTLSYKLPSLEVCTVATLSRVDTTLLGRECQIETEWREGVNTLVDIRVVCTVCTYIPN